MASFLGLGLFDPDEADEPVGFSDNLDDYTFDSIEGATKSSKHASSRPKPVPEHTANVLDFEVLKYARKISIALSLMRVENSLSCLIL